MYDLVLWLHILGFGLWLGAVVIGTVTWRRRIRDAGPEAIVDATGDWRSVDRFVSEPSAIVVLLAGGYLMSAGDFDFDTETWIHFGFGALVGSVLLSIFGVGFARRRIVRAEGRDVDGLVTRATWSAVGAAVLILVGLWVMVSRPVL
jgi:hypothetical protein